MIGNLDVADNVFLAGQGLGENSAQQIFRAHALNLRGYLFAAMEAQEGKGASRGPAPADTKQRRSEHGLFQNLLHGSGQQIAEDVGERSEERRVGKEGRRRWGTEQ